MDGEWLKLYREEMKHLRWWKSGMDATRNIAVAILFGMIFVAFGFGEVTSHRVPYFGSLAVFALVLFEVRLYRFHAVTETRVRLLERNVIAPALDSTLDAEGGWEQQLAESYAHPPMPGFFKSIAFRIYKNYFILFMALDTSWLSKVYLSPEPPASFPEFVHRLDLGIFAGWATLAFMALFWTLFVVAVLWVRMKKRTDPLLLGY